MPYSTVIHIVEDDAAVCRALARLLRAFGYESRSYGTAEEFLRSGGVRAGHLLILDIRLPGISGFDLCERLSALRVNLPVVLMSGQEGQESIHGSRLANVTGFLRKPFDDSKLLEAIEAGLNRSRLFSAELPVG